MSKKPKILLVEDEALFAKLVARVLGDAGMDVVLAHDGQTARVRMNDEAIDIAIVDLLLGEENGLDLIGDWRNRPGLGLIILTKKASVIDRIVGIELGADDYLAKPFEPRELEARVKRLLTRLRASAAPEADPAPEPPKRYSFAGWTLDAAACVLTNPEGSSVDLTSTEYRLMEIFAARPNRVLSRDQLLDLLHGRGASATDRSIDVMVAKIRQKLAACGGEVPILTIRGMGYKLALAPDETA